MALTIWSFGIYFSPIARDQYRARNDGHDPQVSKSDLGFALHGFLLSSFQFVQVYYYTYYYRREKNAPILASEEDPLLPEREDPDLAVTSQPTQPSLVFKVLIAVAWTAAITGGIFTWIGNFELLDWLYLISTIKLAISIIKFIPQVLLNWRLKSSEGFSVAMPALVSLLLRFMVPVPSTKLTRVGSRRRCSIIPPARRLVRLYRTSCFWDYWEPCQARSGLPVDHLRHYFLAPKAILVQRRIGSCARGGGALVGKQLIDVCLTLATHGPVA